jgi:hypothetical protein
MRAALVIAGIVLFTVGLLMLLAPLAGYGSCDGTAGSGLNPGGAACAGNVWVSFFAIVMLAFGPVVALIGARV